MAGYVIVQDLIETTDGASTQLNAPAGHYVAATYIDPDTSAPYFAQPELTVDGNGRVTGALFNVNPEEDFVAGLVCVPDAAAPNGQATLVAGTVAVPASMVTANSRIFVSQRTPGGTTVGNVYRVTARTPGTGFTITAVILATGLTGILDTSVVDWVIIEP